MKLIIKTSMLFILLGIFSCRIAPEDEKDQLENISQNKQTLVNINILGVEFENNNLENNIISENNTQRGGIIP